MLPFIQKRCLQFALCAPFSLGPLAFGQVHAAAPTAPAAIVKQYCSGCHNQKLKTAGIALDTVDPAKVGPDAAVWEKVLQKVSVGQMPPPGMPRPKPEVSAAFTQWLQGALDNAAASNPDPGHPTIHRLNRAEYSNAVRDLLALDVKPGSKLPTDDSGYGFDNIGDVLSLSPVLIERYMSVARMVSRLAVGDTEIKPEAREFDVPKLGKGRRAGRISDALPFDSAGGLAIEYHFPVDAEYLIKIKLGGTEQRILEERLPVKAGTRMVGVTFLAQNTVPEVIPVALGAGAGATPTPAPGKLDIRLDGERIKLLDVPQSNFSSVTIAGPYNIQGTGSTPSRDKIFVCKSTTPKEDVPCASTILTKLARRAYRRPVTSADVQPLLSFYKAGRQDGGSFDHGIEMALQAMLVSPNFLFRVERDRTDSGMANVERISDLELASRLSFFLWSSIPDEELLGLAEKGKLKEPAVLTTQVDRMLEDRRSKAFVNNFAGQWLYLRNLAQVKPDQDAFPEYDLTLRQAFEEETNLFFNAILRENRPVTELLSANFTYLNQRLAEHYEIPGIYGSQYRRVTMTDPNRGGLLGQGSILTVTSYPNRTSVVQRGKWVLENLIGSPPPPPPPDVDTNLETKSKDGKLLTMRQQMEQHRANPTCAGCHSRMDPIGFALENYDGVGKWRAKDAGSDIDATGKLPDGTTFKGPEGLKNLLVSAHKDEFVETFTEKLLTFALGRGLEYYDKPAVRAIVRDAAPKNTTIPALIHSVVNSPQFQTRRIRET